MQKEFIKYLQDTCGASEKNRFLLAVSGGIDSVAMLKLFQLSGLDFAIAHCNFHLRGAESDDDRQFVQTISAEIGKTCYVKDFDIAAYVSEKGGSVQMAARNLRYAWFEELSEKQGFDHIVTGHNQNDVVETVLLNFSRGTGIRGLTGINPRHGKVIRPLLFASRNAIMQFARDNDLTWREDSSNAEQKYSRNKIRHTIIPAFESINPTFMSNALETVVRLDQAEKLLDVIIKQVKQAIWTDLPDRQVLDFNKLMTYPAVELLLFELLRDYSINPLTVKSILDSFRSIPGKQFHTRTHCITRDRSGLIISRKSTPPEAEVLVEPEIASIDYPVHLEFTVFEIGSDYNIPHERYTAALDADKISFPLKIRHWKTGDRFHPLGMRGSKKISDFLINNKIPLPDKSKIWILETAGNIAWIVNFRIDDRFRITAKTRKILLVTYFE